MGVDEPLNFATIILESKTSSFSLRCFEMLKRLNDCMPNRSLAEHNWYCTASVLLFYITIMCCVCIFGMFDLDLQYRCIFVVEFGQ